MAIMIKTPQEIEKMRISGKALRQVHNAIAPHVVPGASTMAPRGGRRQKDSRTGRHRRLQGLSRLPRRPLHLCQRRGRPWHPQRQTRPQRGGHPLHRLRRHHRRLLLRRRRDLPHRQGQPTNLQTPRSHPGLPRESHPAVPGRRAPRRHLRRGPGTLRGPGLRRRPRVRRPRHRPLHAREPQVPNFGPAGKGPRLKPGMLSSPSSP